MEPNTIETTTFAGTSDPYIEYVEVASIASCVYLKVSNCKYAFQATVVEGFYPEILKQNPGAFEAVKMHFDKVFSIPPEGRGDYMQRLQGTKIWEKPNET